MTADRPIIALATLAIIIAAQGFAAGGTPACAADIVIAPGIAHAMSRHVDRKYGFSFWYPRALPIAAAVVHDEASFPGGTRVETLQVGAAGGVSVHVVVAPGGTVTDEPNGRASPIPQTRYFYDAAAQRWMVAYPEGAEGGGSGTPKPADVSKTTVGGLPMLPSGARFDTTIIPLSTTLFVVVQDGGGSAFTNELAATVAPAEAAIDAPVLKAALKAEAIAYEGQLQRTISPATLCALSASPCER